MLRNKMASKLIAAAIIVFQVMSHSVCDGAKSGGSSGPLRPNILIFLADNLGIGDVGCFGNDTIRTPNIDRIAADGAKLTHHLAGAAVCTPSRAAIMTGRYPIRSGLAASSRSVVIYHSSVSAGLPSNETTIGEAAKAAGYNTALIGKWHLGIHCGIFDLYCHHPLRQGFDYYYGLPAGNMPDFGKNHYTVFGAAFPDFKRNLIALSLSGLIFVFLLWKFSISGKLLSYFLLLIALCPLVYVNFYYYNFKLVNSMIMRNYDVVEQPINFENLTQSLVNEGVQFMQEQKKSGKPFLLFVSALQVHPLLHAAKRFQGKSRHGMYGDEVEELDWSVGEFVSALERLKLLDNTLVYFTSDNGAHVEENLDGPQLGGWNGIFRGAINQGGMDGGIRMPTAIMWKGHIKPNTVINLPTSLMDVLPTLLTVWGQPLPTDRIIDGKNIYPLLTGQDTTTPPHKFMIHYCGTAIHAARYVPDNGGDVFKVFYATHNWLPGQTRCAGYACNCDGEDITEHSPPLLYNIGRDPGEKLPLDTTDPTNQEIVRLVNEAVEAHRKGVQSVPEQLSPLNQLPLPWLQHCCNFPFCSCSDPARKYQ